VSVPEQAAVPSARGLKGGALGFVQSTAIGLASTAPAYSIAATLGFVVALVGPQTLLLVPLAFIPMFFSAWANKEMNRADPDCGTSFTWAARALGPRTGWFFGGWGTIASALLAMASYAQITGQYTFLFLGAKGIGNNATSGWVLLTGLAFLALLTYLCYRGIQVSARIQVALLVLEFAILLLLSVVALVKYAAGHAPKGHGTFSWSWLDPSHFASPSVFMAGMLLMVMSSSAATAMTTILPNARTTLSMAFHKALPKIFGHINPRYLTPDFGTISFSAVAAVMYVAINWMSGGNVISDSVTATTLFVAMYLGITGFACTWFYRKSLLTSQRSFWLRGVLPGLSGVMLFAILGWSLWFYHDPNNSYTTWHLPFWPHWTLGGVLSIGIITALAGLAWMLSLQRSHKEFFSGQAMRDGVSITDDDRVVRVGA
jgi:amino acid transporter